MKQRLNSFGLSDSKHIKVPQIRLNCAKLKENESRQRQSIRIHRNEGNTSRLLDYPKLIFFSRNNQCNQCQTDLYSQQEEFKLNDSVLYDYLNTVDLPLTNLHPESTSVNANYVSNSDIILKTVPSYPKILSVKGQQCPLALSNETLQKAINNNLIFNNIKLPLSQSSNPTHKKIISNSLLGQGKLLKDKGIYYPKIISINKKLIQIKKLFKQAIYKENRILLNNKL